MSGINFQPLDYYQTKLILVTTFAVFTLFVAIWRGSIHAQQIEQQKEQGKRTEQQIELSRKQLEETQVNNLAKQAAGIAILNSIAIKPEQIFSHEVTDLLIIYVNNKEILANNIEHKKLINTLSYLENIAENKPENNIKIHQYKLSGKLLERDFPMFEKTME